jgi:hypothetical protein
VHLNRTREISATELFVPRQARNPIDSPRDITLNVAQRSNSAEK